GPRAPAPAPPTRPAPPGTAQPHGWSGVWGSRAAPAEATPQAPGPPAPSEAAGEGPARTGLPLYGVIAAALLGAALIVGLALSIPWLLENLRGDAATYAVGTCLVRAGDP